jgi:hypothetical protein
MPLYLDVQTVQVCKISFHMADRPTHFIFHFSQRIYICPPCVIQHAQSLLIVFCILKITALITQHIAARSFKQYIH